MSEVNIKINKSQNKITEPSNQDLLKKTEAARPPSQKIRWLFGLFIVLLLVSAALIAFLFYSRPAQPFNKILPPNPALVLYFDKADADQLLQSLKESNFAWPPFVQSQEELLSLLHGQNIYLSEVAQLLKNDLVLALFNRSGPSPAWLLIAQSQISQEKIKAAAEERKNQLKQNFGLAENTYRQIKIIEIKSIKTQRPGVYFAIIDDYLALTNSLDDLKQVIDKVLR